MWFDWAQKLNLTPQGPLDNASQSVALLFQCLKHSPCEKHYTWNTEPYLWRKVGGDIWKFSFQIWVKCVCLGAWRRKCRVQQGVGSMRKSRWEMFLWTWMALTGLKGSVLLQTDVGVVMPFGKQELCIVGLVIWRLHTKKTEVNSSFFLHVAWK